MSRLRPSHSIYRERVRAELAALDQMANGTAATDAPPKVPCLDCRLRNVCKVQGLACADLLAYLKRQPTEGLRRPTAALFAQVQALQGGAR